MPSTTMRYDVNHRTCLTCLREWRTLIDEQKGSVRMRRVSWSVIAFVLALPTMAQAQQTETYAYDVHGRLTGVTRTTGGSSQTTTYALDKADNRTSRAVSAPSSARMSSSTEEAQDPAPAADDSDRRPEAQAVPAADAPAGGAL